MTAAEMHRQAENADLAARRIAGDVKDLRQSLTALEDDIPQFEHFAYNVPAELKIQLDNCIAASKKAAECAEPLHEAMIQIIKAYCADYHHAYVPEAPKGVGLL